MVDMHAHVLPALDDGPKHEENALELLGVMRRSGVDTVICTSHFYPDQRSMESFAASRDKRIAAMRSLLAGTENEVTLVPGAEVFVNRILFNYDTLSPLCFGNSRTVLFELPERGYEFDDMFEMLGSLSGNFSVDPIIAHIERVPYLYRHYDRLRALREYGFRLQLDADCLFAGGFFMRQFAVKCIRAGLVGYIGSDCHNVTDRAPNLKEAYEVILKSCGADAVRELKRNAAELAAEA